MVLNDVTREYQKFINILEKYNTEHSFINSGLYIISTYQNQINSMSSTYIHSSKNTADTNQLLNDMRSITAKYSQYIANMNSGIRNTTLLISELNNAGFESKGVHDYAEEICASLDDLLFIIESYSASKITGVATDTAFFKLIDELAHFKELYYTVSSNSEFLTTVEQELLHAVPDYIGEEEPIYTLDVRSYKSSTNISTFVNDLQLLVNALTQMETLLAPGEGSAIFLRKIESGSLKAVLGSIKIDLSVFSNLINSLSQAIRTFRLTPAEKRQIEAQTLKTEAEANKLNAEAYKIQVEARATEMQLINSQVDFLMKLLDLDPTVPENKERIQQLCLPVLRYLEANPQGQINDIKYDISKEVHLLEEK